MGDSTPQDVAADDIDRLYRAACGLTGSRQDAEDLAQETLARVLSRPRAIRHRDDARYLMRALRNTWIDQQRARAARPVSAGPVPLDWAATDAGDPSGTLLDVQAIFGAIHELTPKLRDAIAAVDLFGLSYSEAARALRIRQGTVQSRLARAREQVSSALLVGEHAC